jgi:uncharacterized protein
MTVGSGQAAGLMRIQAGHTMPPPFAATIPDNSEPELEALEDCCRRLAGFRDGVNVEWVDGFMTAAAAGPRRIELAECLAALFGDDFTRTFADPADVAQATAAFLARHRVLMRQLDAEALLDEPDRLRLAPILLRPPSDGDEARPAGHDEPPGRGDPGAHDDTGIDWAAGFLDAVDVFEADWPAPDIGTDEGRGARDALESIAALTLEPKALAEGLARRRPGLTLSREALIDEACWAAQDLRLYWVDHAPRPAPLRLGERPGRNDPCPCGSGRKYKKCHGSAPG